MSKRLTVATRLSDLRREAKRWLKALRANDVEALDRLQSANPSGSSKPSLRTVQLALAREYGFPGWTELKQAVSGDAGVKTACASLNRYERMVEHLLDAYRTGTPEAMERHWNDTWHRRSWEGMRRYVLADLGMPAETEDQRIDITQDDARFLIAREAGFDSWAALTEYVRSAAIGKHEPAARPIRLPNSGYATRDWNEVIEILSSGAATELDAQGQMTDDVLAEIAAIETITSLRFGQSSTLSKAGADHLTRMPQLRHLDLAGCRISDPSLSFLGQLPALENLSLAGTRTTDTGMASLGHCRKLQRVDLSWTPTGDGAIRALAGMDALAEFRSGMLVTDVGLGLLTEFPVFRKWRGGEQTMSLLSADAGPNYLFLRGPFTDRGLAGLADLNGLFALNIHDKRLDISANGLRPLRELPHLGWLAYQTDDEAMVHIAAMPKLRFLLCQDASLTDVGYRTLSRSGTIEYIWASDSEHLSDSGFRSLSTMRALRALSINFAEVSDDALALLPEFSVLRELMPVGVPDSGFRHIGLCEALESLILMYCRETTDLATEHIRHLRNLAYYYASYTQMTDRTPELLSQIESLRHIELVGCAGVTNAGIKALARLPKLEKLELSGMQNVTREAKTAFPGSIEVRLTP